MTDHKKIVLVVEDEESLRPLLRDNLTKEGFTVFEAKNGLEGLDIALLEHPDLILLDILMPVMDGITMLKRMYDDAWGKDAKVIMLTNLGTNEAVAEALALGSHDFLVKSDWKIGDLIKVVHDKLKE